MMLRVLPSVADHATLLRKARNYVAQASLPMPDRGETYNLLLRLGPENVLTSEFLEGIDRDAPLRSLREVYAATTAKSLINRMLALDFKFTLADSDLPKVTRMCELAGVDVVFPMLDDDLIDFAGGAEEETVEVGGELAEGFGDGDAGVEVAAGSTSREDCAHPLNINGLGTQ